MSILSLIPVFFATALVAPAAWSLARVHRRSRGPRETTCPEAGQLATIEMDARHAVAMHALGETHRRVKSCSLWPQRQDCARACLRFSPGTAQNGRPAPHESIRFFF